MRDPSPRLALIGAVVGLIAVSHAVVFIRLAEPAHPILIAAARMGIAALILLPPALFLARNEWRAAPRGAILLSLAAGLVLAAHFATWIASLSLTSIVNSTALVTLNPIWIALFAILLGQRRPGPLTWAAIALSVGGALVLTLGSLRAGPDPTVRLSPLGDGLALLGGVLMAGYLLLGQRIRVGFSLLAYVGLCYPAAAVALWLAVPATGAWDTSLPAQAWVAMIALGLISQIVGHSAYNWTLSVLSPGFVALCLLGEPVLGAIFGMVYFAEYPTAWTWAGGALILGGVALGLRAERRAAPRPLTDPG